METLRGASTLSADLDDEAVVGDGEGEDVAAAAAHEGVDEAGEDALRLPSGTI